MRSTLKPIILFLLLAVFCNVYTLNASDDDKHPHDDQGKEEKHVDHDDQGKEEKHGDHDDHGKEEKKGEQDEHEEHGSSKAIGPGKAIESFDEHDGLKLNPKSLEILGIKTAGISGLSTIPEGAFLSIKAEKAIFVLRESHFLRLPVKGDDSIQSLKNKKILKATDELVTVGADILRVSEIYATDKAEYGHGH